MSTNLNESASSPDLSAAATLSEAPDTSAAQAADESAAMSDDAAASGIDDISQLDQQYKKNLLAPDEPEETPETPEPEPVEAKEPEEEAEEVDPLAEQTGPRTIDDINKQYPRAPIPVREEIARLETEKWALQGQVDELGGTVGLEVAKGIMPLLLKANSTEQDAEAFLNTVFDTNAPLGIDASRLFLTKSLTEESIDPATGLPIREATGNALLKEFVSENFDVEKLKKLAEYEEAGLLDYEELDKELQSYAGESEQVKELKQRLQAVEDRDRESQAAKETDARKQSEQHFETATNLVSQQLMGAVVPLAEYYGWTATKEEINSSDPQVKALAESKIAMGEMLTAWVNVELKKQPEWAAVEHLAKTGQALNSDSKPTSLFTANSAPLVNRMTAKFKAMVRTLNPTFAKSFGLSRPAQLKAKTTRSGATAPVPPVKKVEEVKAGDPIAAFDARYRERMRELQAS